MANQVNDRDFEELVLNNIVGEYEADRLIPADDVWFVLQQTLIDAARPGSMNEAAVAAWIEARGRKIEA